MKKLIIYLVIFAMILSSSGCGAKQKLEEKIAEKIVETAVGGNIDIDGDKVTVKGENGEEVSFGSTEWPTTELAKKIPEFKKGTLTNVISSETGVMMSVEKTEEQDFNDYYKNIVKDFTKDSYFLASKDGVTYTGKNDKGVIVSITYSLKDKALNISGSQGEISENTESSPDTDTVFLSNLTIGNMRWATPEFASKLPSFDKGKIESISSSKGYFTIIINEVEKDDYQKYYENIKGSFTVDAFEFNNAESASYYGGDDNGLNVTLSYTYKDKLFSISATKN